MCHAMHKHAHVCTHKSTPEHMLLCTWAACSNRPRTPPLFACRPAGAAPTNGGPASAPDAAPDPSSHPFPTPLPFGAYGYDLEEGAQGDGLDGSSDAFEAAATAAAAAAAAALMAGHDGWGADHPYEDPADRDGGYQPSRLGLLHHPYPLDADPSGWDAQAFQQVHQVRLQVHQVRLRTAQVRLCTR